MNDFPQSLLNILQNEWWAVDDDEKSGRPASAVCSETVNPVRTIVGKKESITSREIPIEMDVWISTTDVKQQKQRRSLVDWFGFML